MGELSHPTWRSPLGVTVIAGIVLTLAVVALVIFVLKRMM